MSAIRLLRWYDANRRDLPWRVDPPDPYRTWISEIMLQQTRVDTVIGYFERFLARFPDVVALADSPLDDVLARWSGLGYYARARNLHAAARRIRDEHGGRFPSDPDAVNALPGIGRYTAGAILSIAFGAREPLVDGNVVRVLSRLHALEGHAKERSLHDRCWEIAASLVPDERPGDFNQALMELGATVCLPSNPRCERCPLAGDCAARALGRQGEIPAVPPKAKRPHRTVACVFVERGGRVLLVRRPDEGLLGGLWELPSAERPDRRRRARGAEDRSGAPHAWLSAEIGSRLGLRLEAVRRVASVDHAFSHFDMTLDAYACEAHGDTRAGTWVGREELAEYGIGAAMRKAIEAAWARASLHDAAGRRKAMRAPPPSRFSARRSPPRRRARP